MRIAVTGGRDYNPTKTDEQAFQLLWIEKGGVELLVGDARGVDRWATQWGHANRVLVRQVRVFRANWDFYGKMAGMIRNGEMLREADALIAFPGGRGTANAVRQARDKGIPVFVLHSPGEGANPEEQRWLSTLEDPRAPHVVEVPDPDV